MSDSNVSMVLIGQALTSLEEGGFDANDLRALTGASPEVVADLRLSLHRAVTPRVTWRIEDTALLYDRVALPLGDGGIRFKNMLLRHVSFEELIDHTGHREQYLLLSYCRNGSAVAHNDAKKLGFTTTGTAEQVVLETLQKLRGTALVLLDIGLAEIGEKLDHGLSVEMLGLSVRTDHALRRNKIRTLADLLDYTEDNLLAIRNFGQSSLGEIGRILGALRLELKSME